MFAGIGNLEKEKVMKFIFWGCVVTVGYCGLNLYCGATLPCFMNRYWSSIFFWGCLFAGWGLSGFLWEDWAKWGNAIICGILILIMLNFQGGANDDSIETIEYTVKQGDTISKIARIKKCPPDLIMQMNNLSSSTLRVRQKLIVPR